MLTSFRHIVHGSADRFSHSPESGEHDKTGDDACNQIHDTDQQRVTEDKEETDLERFLKASVETNLTGVEEVVLVAW